RWRKLSFSSSVALQWHEVERHRIDAVAEASRLRSIAEQIAQMRVASAARDLAVRVPAARLSVVHVLLGDRLPIARPSGARIELRVRREERSVAADAAEQSLLVEVPVGARKRPLRARFARDVIRERCQLLAPLRRGLDDLRHAHGAEALALVGKLH